MIRIDCINAQDSGYLYAYLKSSTGQKILKSLAYGAVIQHINPEHLNDIPVPNAPQELRSRIHDLIIRSYALRDESNKLLDEAENILIRELALPPLDDMRRHEGSILAFDVQSQDLQGRFEASFHDPLFNAIVTHLKEHAQEVINLGDERITRKILLPGRFKRVYVNEGYGAVFTGGKQIGELDPNDKKYLAFSQHDDLIREELTIHENIILITRSGTLGSIAIVPKHWENWTASEDIIRLTVQEGLEGYAWIWLQTDYVKFMIESLSYGAVIRHIEPEHIEIIPFPLLKDKDSQALINSLALEANSKRFEACNLEREAMKIMEGEIICSNVD